MVLNQKTTRASYSQTQKEVHDRCKNVKQQVKHSRNFQGRFGRTVVLTSCLNVVNDIMMHNWSVVQTRGVATGKVQSPMVEQRVQGVSK